MASEHNPVIVIVAYKREDAVKRLLKSINDAYYPNKNIRIIISLDGGSQKKVVKCAKDFVFEHGSVKVVERVKNLGLRNHILSCGDLSEIYGSVIILEDDIAVDPFFYIFAVEAQKFYENDERIGGVALYSQRYNEYACMPFEPQYNGTSAYFMQVACSWGQCWTERQWKDFKNFYKNVSQEDINNCLELPRSVKRWPETSWKKYFSYYLVVKNKTFVYPYISYSTNCSDEGGIHILKQSNLYQVPMPARNRICEKFVFEKDTINPIVEYDSFMEPVGSDFFDKLGISKEDVEVDFYGTKTVELLRKKRYTITIKSVGSEERKITLRFKPFEKNDFSEKGSELFAAFVKSKNIGDANLPIDLKKYIQLLEYFSYAPLVTVSGIASSVKNIVKKYLLKLYGIVK